MSCEERSDKAISIRRHLLVELAALRSQ